MRGARLYIGAIAAAQKVKVNQRKNLRKKLNWILMV